MDNVLEDAPLPFGVSFRFFLGLCWRIFGYLGVMLAPSWL